MFVLVDDVSSYVEFLPWCGGSEVLEGDGSDEKVAKVDISFKGIRQSFTTRNKLTSARSIDMELVDGPFNHLVGRWEFEELSEEACKISLFVEFTFSNRVAEMAIGPLFKQITGSMVDAFVLRAKDIYG
jgi:ribosome-associated toxin RatA of RatAB toxin-antitoxin module